MAFNQYLSSLLGLRQGLENKIDAEIDSWMRGRADSEHLKESLLWVIEESSVLKGFYKDSERPR